MPAECFDAEKEELHCARLLHEKLEEHFGLLDRAADGLYTVIAAREDLKPLTVSRAVSQHILCGIRNDIRAIRILAERGYPKQAQSLLAGLIETAQDAVIIGDDDDLASEWLKHKDRKHRFSKSGKNGCLYRDRYIKGLRRIGFEEQITSDFAKSTAHSYHNSCMFKHSNPLMELDLAFNSAESSYESTIGPVSTEGAQNATRNALLNAAGFAALAVCAFVHVHVLEDRRPHYVLLLWPVLRDAARLESR